MCRTDKILDDMGVAYYKIEDEGSSAVGGKKFADLLPELCSNNKVSFCQFVMYPHQQEGIEKLMQGKNLIINSETGSGKTEIWVSYALQMMRKDKNFRALAIYPTKALEGDQISRIIKYMKEAGFNVEEEEIESNGKKVKVYKGDIIRYDGDVSAFVKKDEIDDAKILLTNPEILKNALENRNHIISDFISKVNLLVIDEFDFYGSYRATFLLYMLKFLEESYGVKPQIVIMSATLKDSEALNNFLKLKFETISGKAFKPRNITYIILGKKDSVNKLFKGGDYREFFTKVLENKAFRSLLKDNQTIAEKLLKKYEDCEEQTLVFTPSKDIADNLAGKIGGKAKYEEGTVAVHHSGLSKEDRRLIEEKLRKGEIKVAISVRTLAQGIDIGNITRVVHYGLPSNVKDFLQREGRKGRRQDMESTESIIIPVTLQDVAILSSGLNNYVSVGSESLFIYPNNDFLKYVEMLWKGNLDENFINSTGADKSNLPKISFYDIRYDTVNRYYYDGKGCKQIDDVSYRDFVEKFMPGYIDKRNSAVVIEVEKDKKKGKYYVLETSVEPSVFKGGVVECNGNKISVPWPIVQAVSKYEDAVMKWGQEHDFKDDAQRGKIWAVASLDIEFSKQFSESGGFKYVKEINRGFKWIVESRRKFKRVINGIETETYDYKVIEVNYQVPTWIEYDFFTYVYLSEVEKNDLKVIEEGMDNFIAYLRYAYGIDINSIKYTVQGNMLKVWESEPIGILKVLREGEKVKVRGKEFSRDEVIKELKSFNPDPLYEMILKQINPRASVNIEAALKAANYVSFGKPFDERLDEINKILAEGGQPPFESYSEVKQFLTYIGNLMNQFGITTKDYQKLSSICQAKKSEIEEILDKIPEEGKEQLISALASISTEPAMDSAISALDKIVQIGNQVPDKEAYYSAMVTILNNVVSLSKDINTSLRRLNSFLTYLNKIFKRSLRDLAKYIANLEIYEVPVTLIGENRESFLFNTKELGELFKQRDNAVKRGDIEKIERIDLKIQDILALLPTIIALDDNIIKTTVDIAVKLYSESKDRILIKTQRHAAAWSIADYIISDLGIPADQVLVYRGKQDVSKLYEQKWRILIATKALSEGIDIPDLTYAILSSYDYGNIIGMVQTIGRTLRKTPTKNKAVVYILVPNLPQYKKAYQKLLKYIRTAELSK
ncbi:MAG: helicase-related protein [Sulfolobus sp.]